MSINVAQKWFKIKILTRLQKLPKNVGDLIVAKGFEKLTSASIGSKYNWPKCHLGKLTKHVSFNSKWWCYLPSKNIVLVMKFFCLFVIRNFYSLVVANISVESMHDVGKNKF